MSAQLLCRGSIRSATCAGIRSTTVPVPFASAAAASLPSTVSCWARPAESSSSRTCTRSFHSYTIALAEAPKTAKAPAAPKKKKDVAAAAPMAVPTSMSQYNFSHLSVLKEYKAPDEKVAMHPDSAYPAWIWDQTPEPTWSDLLLADFAKLPPTYQKKVFSMPRKLEIKKHNDLTRKG